VLQIFERQLETTVHGEAGTARIEMVVNRALVVKFETEQSRWTRFYTPEIPPRRAAKEVLGVIGTSTPDRLEVEALEELFRRIKP
jgi:hypothetical protein